MHYKHVENIRLSPVIILRGYYMLWHDNKTSDEAFSDERDAFV